MDPSSRRAEQAAITALVLNVIFYVVTWVLGAVSKAFAISALAWQMLGGVFIWLVLVLLFHQRSLAEQEKLDMAQLAKAKDTADTIFQGNADRTALFAVAQKRLVVFEKWFVPIFSVLIAVYEIGIGIFLFTRAGELVGATVQRPQLMAVFMVIIAFMSFLISRYVTGMSAEGRWKLLRAGGSYLLAGSILAFLSGVALAFAQFKITVGLTILGWGIPVLLTVLGIEIALNAVLDIYRPRIAGQYSRSAFDSRLLGLINEPGEILHTFASAIDYQFGFEVSQTWFYKLLAKAIIPLVLFSIVALYSLSCLVIVGPGAEAVIERFGSFDQDSVVGPGLTFKLPWPFGVARRYPTKQIQEVSIGFVEEADDEEHQGDKPILWGKEHYHAEYNLLVATKAEGTVDEEGAVPISLVRAAIPVQYRIRDLYSFVYNHSDAAKMLEAICYRELTRYCVSAKLETDDDGGHGNLSLLGAGRKEAARVLTERIQKAADELKLGLEIVFLGLQGVHPPPEIANAYQQVVGSVQKKQALILKALAERNKILSSLAGSVSEANRLYELVVEYTGAKEAGDSEAIVRITEELNTGFDRSSGEIFKVLSEAQSYAFEKGVLAEATGRRFQDQLRAYRASPKIYKHLQRLTMLEESLDGVRKYVIITDENDTEVIVIDLKEKLTPSLYDLDMETIEQSQ